MKKIESKIIMQIPYSIQNTEIPIYEIFGKSELQDLLNKLQIVRILSDGKTAYVWNANYFKHNKILQHLKDFGKPISNLAKFNLTKTTLFFGIPQKVEIGKEFLNKFLNPKSLIINDYGIDFKE